MSAPTIKNKAVTQSPSANTTVSVALPTFDDGDSCAIIIGRSSNQLLTAGAAAAALGFARYALKQGSSSTTAQGELWVATGLSAASSGATITFTSSANRNWRAVALAVDSLNMDVFASSGSESGGVWTWGTVGGDQSVSMPSVAAPTEALLLSALFDKTDVARTVTGTGWTEEDDGRSGNTGGDTNICHVTLASKTVAAGGLVAGPTIARDDAGNTTSTCVVGTVALVAAASNALPTALIAESGSGIVANVGEETTFLITVTDLDGSVVDVAVTQDTSLGSTVTAPDVTVTDRGGGTWLATFTPTEQGAFTLKAIATDNEGAHSVPVSVGVVAMPSLSRRRSTYLGGHPQRGSRGLRPL